MSFKEDCQGFEDQLLANGRAVFEGAVHGAFRSVVNGSAVTGAPGQPVGATHALKESWTAEIGATEATIASDHPAAGIIEGGTREGRALVFHSSVGGPHSVALTAAAWPALVQTAAEARG